MEKISNREIVDVVRYTDNKIIVVEKKPVIEGSGYKPNYFIVNVDTLEKEVITKNAYLMKKFGPSYQRITETIANFVQCDVAILSDRSVFIIFPNGQCGMFDSNGKVMWNDTLSYNGKPVTSLAPDGNYIWCCCREENCVIRYSLQTKLSVDIRIGAKEAKTFILPSSLSSDRDNIYVCCNSAKLRRIAKSDFTVSDLGAPIPGLQKFYRIKDHALICTTDGAYID